MDRKSADELQKHMLGTYRSLRMGLTAIGFGLPLLVLFAGGVLHHVWLEPSISQYYHTVPRLSFLTTRDLFVGGLFAAGACLYLYKGFSTKENLALNLAGVFVAFVAVLPTAAPGSERGLVSRLHWVCAVLFFLGIAYVSLFRSHDTLELLPPTKRARYAQAYFWTGLAMIASPAGAIVLSYVLDDPASPYRTLTFWVETLGLWAFAAYWFIKTREMRETEGERRTLDGELKREVVPAKPPGEDIGARVGGVSGALLRKLSQESGEAERIVPV
jgi:hypothetical protein